MSNLTIEEKACNDETWQHINKVQHYLNFFIKELLDRGNEHDSSKLEQPEVGIISKFITKLSEVEYESQEYKELKKQLQPALENHYAKNRHHAEHHKNGMNDMNLIDIIELFCDWKASTLRNKNGNLLKSIEMNAKRYNMSPQLVNIFENTAELIDNV